MSFSTALGVAQLGMSALGMFGANRKEQNAMAMRNYELELMGRDQMWNRMMGDKAFASQQEENEYRRNWEQLNRRRMEDERKWQIEMFGDYTSTLSDERQYEIDRQIEMDREQARISQMQLEQMLRNQKLSADERKFAVSQLEQAKAVAAGEREEDMRRFYQERAQAQQERDFVMQQFYGSQNEARLDQGRDLALRETLMGQVDGMRSKLSSAMMQMGGVPDAPQFSQADLDGEIDRRTGQYQSDVERAATLAASQNEANLIRAGLDGSTPGTARRSDVARRIADELQSARSRAYDDALGYITGKQGAQMTAYNADMQRRGQILDEIMGVEGAGMSILQQLPQYRSLSDQGEIANQMKTGIYNRQVNSANQYSAPVTINSAIYDSMNLTPRMSNYNVGASAADKGFFSVGSSVFNPVEQNLNDPTNFWANASTIGQQRFGAADNFYVDARDRSNSATAGFGQDFRALANDLGPQLDSWWATRTATANAPTSVVRPQARPLG